MGNPAATQLPYMGLHDQGASTNFMENVAKGPLVSSKRCYD